MNSLNIISARVSPASSTAPTRSNSLSSVGLAAISPSDDPTPVSDPPATGDRDTTASPRSDHVIATKSDDDESCFQHIDEKTPLIDRGIAKEMGARSRTWHTFPARVASSLINSIRWVLSTVAAPGVYLIACFCDEDGNFSPLRQLKTLFGKYGGDAQKLAADYHETIAQKEKDLVSRSGSKNAKGKHGYNASRPAMSSGSSSSGFSSESESDVSRTTEGSTHTSSSSARHARSKSLQPTEELEPSGRSIRIKLHSEGGMRRGKHRKAQSTNTTNASTEGNGADDLSAQLKSPTSPIGALTKYPKTPAPPRPLLPRRQPSYIPYEPSDPKQLKTLILDLDETLIHSMSKGGRMGSGHMVEVRLNTAYGSGMLGPQHPILYYVHKRPHCDEFLRKVCKWFNLVVFTASVQEYADPVIDWLESERKYFSGRYYRQHCTFRHGAFIKDLSSIEPDLSKVMILDNSPLSYMFHQDNAIPIQGWISDPTDHDLLHLVPFLEGLQYVSDVRALLALRGGEDGQHVT
ncbi:NLI interacting factor-like phosphatase-domain-containing protein [Xylariaceae sp. FL1019]|nr:NLI interacting factor-like phosphatase-domain-containing protein [Xylariaceae sp. FL1019]